MDRRSFLTNLSAIAAALLVAPRSALKELFNLFAPSGRVYHFAHTWLGDTRRTWIDGEEVFGESVQNSKDVTIGGGFYQALSSNQGSISFWIALPWNRTALGSPLVPSDGISWTRLDDDSPFEPPQRTDPPAVVDSDIGEGDDLVDSWW